MYVVMNKEKNRVVIHHDDIPGVVLSGNFDSLDDLSIMSLKAKIFNNKVKAWWLTLLYSGFCVVDYEDFMKILCDLKQYEYATFS